MMTHLAIALAALLLVSMTGMGAVAVGKAARRHYDSHWRTP